MSDVDKEFNELQELKDRNEELMNNWKRTAADLENFKKRVDAERKELVEFSKEITVMKLIPSLESLEQVLIYAPQDDKYKEWLAGLKATIQQLEKSMEDLGVYKVKTIGQPFDHSMHEAVEEVDGIEGQVIKELQPGFMLNGKVIIPAKVAVGKKS
ncbi:MAG: nucleotide exchange factor GrpE [Candidatus Doudnabacteria bacterium]|nr:nucleotide exchange factor GrpE [Candidatus Doudnabacteria bacterium]